MKIAHVFKGAMQHHVPGMMRLILQYAPQCGTSPAAHEFIVAVDGADQRSFYQTPGRLPEGCRVRLVDSSPVALGWALARVPASTGIVIHGGFIQWLWPMLCASRFGRLAHVAWICWGADLLPGAGLKGRLLLWLRRYLYQRMACVVTLVTAEAEIARKAYPGCGRILVAPYLDDMESRFPPGLPRLHGTGSKDLRVLVGNSAWPSNNHEEILKLFSRFRDQPLRVYCPLSYGGTAAYKEHVIQIGQSLLGGSFVPLTEVMPAGEFDALLRRCDILILNNANQQALFSMYAFLFQGKKIYLRAGSQNYAWARDLGMSVGEVARLAEESFDQFAAPLGDLDSLRNVENARKHLGLPAMTSRWREVYAFLRRGPSLEPDHDPGA